MKYLLLLIIATVAPLLITTDGYLLTLYYLVTIMGVSLLIRVHFKRFLILLESYPHFKDIQGSRFLLDPFPPEFNSVKATDIQFKVKDTLAIRLSPKQCLVSWDLAHELLECKLDPSHTPKEMALMAFSNRSFPDLSHVYVTDGSGHYVRLTVCGVDPALDGRKLIGNTNLKNVLNRNFDKGTQALSVFAIKSNRLLVVPNVNNPIGQFRVLHMLYTSVLNFTRN